MVERFDEPGELKSITSWIGLTKDILSGKFSSELKEAESKNLTASSLPGLVLEGQAPPLQQPAQPGATGPIRKGG